VVVLLEMYSGRRGSSGVTRQPLPGGVLSLKLMGVSGGSGTGAGGGGAGGLGGAGDGTVLQGRCRGGGLSVFQKVL
jgi:hypothetical protein